MLNTVVSLFYYARVLGPAYFRDPDGRPATLGVRPAVAVALCAVALVALGVGAELAFRAFSAATLLPG